MSETVTILALWAAFISTHMVLSSNALRPRLVGVLGSRVFGIVYSAIALAIFIPLVRVYFAHKHAGPELWSVPLTPTILAIIYLGMAIAFVLFVAGLVTPSPVTVAIGDQFQGVRGIHRITRHAIFMGVALFGAVHLIANGFASDIAFFGVMPAYVLVGFWHQDRRKLALGDQEFRRYYDQTPFFPFTGRETLRGLRELPLVVILIGVALTIVLRIFHEPLFG